MFTEIRNLGICTKNNRVLDYSSTITMIANKRYLMKFTNKLYTHNYKG